LNQIWSGTVLGKTYRLPFIGLSNNDQIRIDGEDSFRKIKKLPGITTSKEHRNNKQLSNSMFGSVDVETYNGIARGEGLSVVAIIQNGKVVDLEWNQRSYNPLTQPTAYQYYIPPVLHFIPQDGNGGGARANVLVSKGQVISVDLIDGGSGYTQAPKVVVARNFDILNERDIGVSVINIGINPFIEHGGYTVFSTVDVLGNQVSDVNSFTSIFFDSPISSDRVITAEIQLVEEVGEDLQKNQLEISRTVFGTSDTVAIIDVFKDSSEIISIVSGRILDIVSTSIVTTNREVITTFENLIPNDALSNVNYYATGAYLNVDLDVTGNVVYVADTSKFKSNGYLLVGDEIIRYYRKLSDRFLRLERGQLNTTTKAWLAGTFIRQLPDPVSTAFGGVVVIESASQIVTVQAGSSSVPTSIQSQYQIVTPTTLDAKESSLEFLIIPPPSGVIDGYEEVAYISDPISTRLNGFINLDDVNGEYTVTTRNLIDIVIGNSIFGTLGEYIGRYEKTNAGHRISHFSGIFSDGSAAVSGLTILELDTYYPSLTLQDFIDRANSSYTLAGDYFNLLPPSIQNPVTISQSTGTINSVISVQKTTYFPTSGYLFTGNGGVIQYTGKTSTSFTGCSVVRGSNTLSVGTEIIPFQIT